MALNEKKIKFIQADKGFSNRNCRVDKIISYYLSIKKFILNYN